VHNATKNAFCPAPGAAPGAPPRVLANIRNSSLNGNRGCPKEGWPMAQVRMRPLVALTGLTAFLLVSSAGFGIR
jgi:hypothetical protein